MVKAAWGKKHTCPKCGKRFYDLGKKGPAVCIECEHKWVPEPILKAKQPIVAPKPAEPPAKKETAPESVGGPDGVDEAATATKKAGAVADADVDADTGISGENAGDDVGVVGDISLDEADQDLSAVVDSKLEQKGDS